MLKRLNKFKKAFFDKINPIIIFLKYVFNVESEVALLKCVC